MQVVEKSGDGLSKVFGVTVPAGELAKRLDARIAEITPRLNIKGFRPGKVPPAHIRRLHGKALMAEVVEQTVAETRQKVCKGVAPKVAAASSIAALVPRSRAPTTTMT